MINGNGKERRHGAGFEKLNDRKTEVNLWADVFPKKILTNRYRHLNLWVSE